METSTQEHLLSDDPYERHQIFTAPCFQETNNVPAQPTQMQFGKQDCFPQANRRVQ
jgi:hypothetical protein